MVINATRDPSGLPQNYGPVHPTNTGPSSLPVHQRAHTSSHPISPPIPPQFSAPAPTFQQAPPNGIPDWLDPIYVSGVFPPTPVRPALQVPLGAGAPLDRHMQAVPNYDAASYLCGIDGCESVLDPETSQSHIRDLHYPPHMNAETVARKQRLQCRYTGCSADVADFYALHRHLQTKHWESSATCPVCELTFDCTDTLVKHLKKYHPAHDVIPQRTRDELERRPYPRPSYARSEQASPPEASTIAGGTRNAAATNRTTRIPLKQSRAAFSYGAVSYRCGIDGCETVLDNETYQLHIRTLHYPPDDDAGTSVRTQKVRCRYTGCDADAAKLSHLYRHLQTTHWQLTVTCPKCKQSFARSDTLLAHLKRLHPDYIPEVKITPIVPATQEYQPLQHHPQHAPSVRDVISQRMGDRHEGHSYPRPSYAPGPSSRPTTHRSHKRREDLRTDSSQAAGLSEQASPSQAPTITGGTRDGTATKPTEQVLQNLRQAVDSYDTASYQCGIDGCETVLNNETSAPHMRSLHYPLPDDPEIFVRTQRLRCRYTGCSADIVNFASLHRHLQTQHWQLRLECPVCQQQYNRPDNLTTHMLYRHPAEYSLTVENATPVPAAQKDQLLQHHMQDTPSARGVVSRRMQDKHEGPPYPGPSYTPGPGSSTTTYHAHQQGEHLRSYPSQTVGRSEQASRSKASQTAEMRGGPAPNQTKQALPKPRKAASLYNAASYRCGIDGCETVLNNDTSTPHIRRLHYPVSGDAGPSAGMQILRCRYMGCNTDTASFSHLHRHLQSTHWELTVTCPVCQRPYSRPDNLKEHLKIIHPEYSQAVANPLP